MYYRAQVLEPLLDALARKAYVRLHKELSFELGEIYQDLADIKILRWVALAWGWCFSFGHVGRRL